MLQALCPIAMAALLAQATQAPARASFDPAFWRSIEAHDFAVPDGHTAAELLLALDPVLASPDPTLRDEIGYTAAARWVYRQRVLTPEELRRLTAHWRDNLKRGLGERDTDTVFLRSFSALDLSIVAALDLEAPFLTHEEFNVLLDDALFYFVNERDERGYDRAKGWIHAVAHTSDLFKFLARSPKLPDGGQRRLLDAVAGKLATTNTVFVWGEQERIAAATASIVRRPDFDVEAFGQWLDQFPAAGRALWANGPAIDPSRFAAVRNATDVLLNLYAMLALDAAASPGTAEARDRVLKTLAAMP
jgi:hypothetical protein